MSRNEISVIGKAWLVVEAFRPTGGPCRLTDLVRRSGLPKTTVHRLTGELVEAGVIERGEDGFHLGRKLFELGSMVPVQRDLRETALPHMHDLFEATHETIHLGVRDGLDVVYVEKIRAHTAIDLPSRIGGRLPLSATGVGKALLAFSPQEVMDEVLSRPLRRLSPHSITDPRRFAEVIGQIQASGLAYDQEEAQPGVSCIAAPVLVSGLAVAALSVAVPTSRFTPARLAPAVKTAALGLSRSLTRPRP
ncbi:IclR family transcriptional regulator [Bailinhaonella thermotolerans]|uniref:IclR family transcriptional regulator n=1 Tax=Bailinhaonella thermotolerans TaxID=1070861 RepID=A0A3A4ASW6_9ACTN|nr:IclR family transcriptional regulator [Bailinhaonella thermotolerans]RJL31395.1 IclR family transcriptional regulator [Bailinhaonella thermotolerans]